MYIFSKASNEIYEVNKKTVQNLEKFTDGVVSHLSLILILFLANQPGLVKL